VEPHRVAARGPGDGRVDDGRITAVHNPARWNPCGASGSRRRDGCQAVAAGYDDGDEADVLTVAPAPPPGAPPALSAFLRGVGRRALLFASLQAGEGPAIDAALSGAVARFAAEAEDLPMGRWPAWFWKQVLASLPGSGAATVPPGTPPGFDLLPALGAGTRVPLLLALVAGLDEEDGAAALGVDAEVWRLALRRAAPHDVDGRFDEPAWRALATASRDAQRALPDARLAWWDRACEAALAARKSARPPATDGGHGPRRRRALPALWAAVAACVLAFAATFVPWDKIFGDAGNAGDANPLPVEGIPLAASASPAATYDAAFALRHHPDLPRLLAGDDALLRELDFGAWYAAQRAAEDDAGNIAPAVQVGTPAGTAVAGGSPFQPRQLPAFDALSSAQRRELEQRIAAEDALRPEARGALRERWEAWQRMPAPEQLEVRRALAAFATLPEEARQSLRDAFAIQSVDLQHGWLLGPTLGRRWPRLQPLLQQVPAAEREPLLARLHAMDTASLDALGVLAQRTPPQSRETLRRRLLAENAPAQTR
jgi:hypothetical protein